MVSGRIGVANSAGWLGDSFNVVQTQAAAESKAEAQAREVAVNFKREDLTVTWNFTNLRDRQRHRRMKTRHKSGRKNKSD